MPPDLSNLARPATGLEARMIKTPSPWWAWTRPGRHPAARPRRLAVAAVGSIAATLLALSPWLAEAALWAAELVTSGWKAQALGMLTLAATVALRMWHPLASLARWAAVPAESRR